MVYDGRLCAASRAARAAVEAGGDCPEVRAWDARKPGSAERVLSWGPLAVVALGPGPCRLAFPGRKVVRALCGAGGPASLPVRPRLASLVSRLRQILPGPRRIVLVGGRRKEDGADLLVKGHSPEHLLSNLARVQLRKGDVLVLARRADLFPALVLRYLVGLQLSLGVVVVGFTEEQSRFGTAFAVGWPPGSVGAAAVRMAAELASRREREAESSLLGPPTWWYNRYVLRALGIPVPVRDARPAGRAVCQVQVVRS